VPADPSVVAALQAAVLAEPENPGLRLHLAVLLLDNQQPVAALGHLRAILARQPDHIEALRLASEAAEASGDLGLAIAWRRLHESLSSEEGVAWPDSQPEHVPAGPGGDGEDEIEITEDWDALLSEVLGGPGDPPRLKLADVGGLDDVKRRLNTTFLAPLRNPELRRMYAKSLRGGLLLWGPPGCGKTMMARAVAGELGARFFSVGLHEVLDMWFGKSEQNLHALFEAARRAMPCVLFLDEVDALGHKRGNLARAGGRNVVVQLLTELDGVAAKNDGLFVLAASNQLWDIDPALRRPGRIDHTVLVLPPDAPARQAILTHHLSDRPVSGLELDSIVRSTDGYSGADLSLVCDTAAGRALEASIETGQPRPIGTADLLAAAKDVRPSTTDWFQAARNYAMFANQGGEYDELDAYIRSHHP